MEKCEEIKILLSSYLDNELTPEEQKKVENHVQECEVCKDELESFRDLNDVLNVVKAPELSSSVALKFKQEIGVIKNQEKFGVKKKPDRLFFRYVLSAAAIIIFSVSLLFLAEKKYMNKNDSFDKYLKNPSELAYSQLMKDTGDVSVVQIFGELNMNMGSGWKKAQPYMPVDEGSELSTPLGSSAIISIQKTTEIKLSEKTSIKVYDEINSNNVDVLTIELQRGTIDASVKNFDGLLVVDTKFGNIKVHGTKFKVITKTNSMAVEVTEGLISFESKGKPVFVAAPNRLIITKDNVCKIEPMENILISEAGPSNKMPDSKTDKEGSANVPKPILIFNEIPVYFPPEDTKLSDVLEINLEKLGYRKLTQEEKKEMYGEFWSSDQKVENNGVIYFKNNDGDFITVQMTSFTSSLARQEWWLSVQPSYEVYNEKKYFSTGAGFWAFRSNNNIDLFCFKDNWTLTVSIEDKIGNPLFKGEMVRDIILKQISDNNRNLFLEKVK